MVQKLVFWSCIDNIFPLGTINIVDLKQHFPPQDCMKSGLIGMAPEIWHSGSL